jgi:DNA-binding cell septation regulator SpoVG
MTDMPKLEAHVTTHFDLTGKTTRVLAFAELTIAGAFTIKGIRVLGKPGKAPYVSFPAQRAKGANGGYWVDVARPANPAAREAASTLILAEYQKAITMRPA